MRPTPHQIRSNEGDYVHPDNVGWMRETSLDTSQEEMRQRFNEDGYIWVKGLIPRRVVLDMREQ
jgi:phytanoyl-CoA hydroxylase